MSDCHKYLFHTDLTGEETTPEGKGIYADPTWARLFKPQSYLPPQTYAATLGSYINPDISGCLNHDYLSPMSKLYGTAGVYFNQNLLGTVNEYLVSKPPICDNLLTTGNPYQTSNYLTGSTTAYYTGVGTLMQTPNTGVLSDAVSAMNFGSSYLPATHKSNSCSESYMYASSQYHVTAEKENKGLGILKTSSIYGAVIDQEYFEGLGMGAFDTWVKPSTPHIYTNGLPYLKMFDTSGFNKNEYLGYGDQVGRQTKDLFALHDQLSLLNEEAIWLTSKVTDEFYKSIYVPYGEDFISYLKSWSESVKVKIQKVEAKFDRLRKYIIKLKISVASMRHINKKRVFRTKVNLIFKNLDDAHSSGLNYFNSVNALYLTFKYHTSWKLTFNNSKIYLLKQS